ncbi:uncharacterized protein LOC142632762 [Castanea sativa]|uniref:uncharacterized protein LOC142632762 n=1 Tax=Castanea sativa TaxID=21020 RepID=UPI003F651ACC
MDWDRCPLISLRNSFGRLGLASLHEVESLDLWILCCPWPCERVTKTYTDRYWEMFNKIDGDFDDVAIRTFKVDLPAEHGLRKSLTGKLIRSVRQLMDQIDKNKRVEEDQQLGKGKVKVVFQDRRNFMLDKYNDNRPRRDFNRQIGVGIVSQVVNTVFREPVHQEGKLQQFLYRPNGHASHIGLGTEGNNSSRPPLATINVIFATPGKADLCPSQIMTVAGPLSENSNLGLKRAKVALQLELSFSEKDKIGIIQPHDDALVVTLRIGGYDVRRVMVDQGSGAELYILTCIEV